MSSSGTRISPECGVHLSTPPLRVGPLSTHTAHHMDAANTGSDALKPMTMTPGTRHILHIDVKIALLSAIVFVLVLQSSRGLRTKTVATTAAGLNLSNRSLFMGLCTTADRPGQLPWAIKGPPLFSWNHRTSLLCLMYWVVKKYSNIQNNCKH